MPNQPIYAEDELVLLLKHKDEQAFGYLYENYSPVLYGVVLRVVNQEEAANDTLQEVFVKIWKNIDSYDATKGRLYTWMLNIARNTAIDMLRSKNYKYDKKIQNFENTVHKDVDNLSSSPSINHIGLEKVLKELKEEQQVIIHLAYFKGYTQEEIAKELDMPLGTVKTRIRNALIKLREILNIKK